MQAVSTLSPNAITHHENYSMMAWLTCLTASLFFFYSFIQVNIFNAIDSQVMAAFHLNAPQLGQLAAMYFYGNTLFLLLGGMLLDRYSTKKILLTAVSIVSLGTLIFALANQYLTAAIGRTMVGIGASVCFLSCIRLASRWFPPQRMALITGCIVTMAMLGGLVAQTPMTILSNSIGWHDTMLINAGIGVMIFAAILLIVKDYPPSANDQHKANTLHLKALGLRSSIKLVLFNPQNWLGGLYTALMNLPIFILGAIWGIPYLQKVHHLSLIESSYATTTLFIGVIFGSPFFGWVSDHIGRRVLPMIVGAILSLIVILFLILFSPLSLGKIICLFFLIGFVTSSQVLSYPVIAELNPPTLTGSAISVVSTNIMASGFIVQPLFGWVMTFQWDHTLSTGIPVYSSHDFFNAMLIMPIAFIISLLIAFKIRETYCEIQG